ncbi:MAG: hypothetical protein HRU20_19910 [Pseudomonadales bacterium]|nr:hypothetical protein [Pseudomonadales bacterium]
MQQSIKSAGVAKLLQRCLCIVLSAIVFAACAQKQSKAKVNEAQMSDYFATADEDITAPELESNEAVAEQDAVVAGADAEAGINPDVFAVAGDEGASLDEASQDQDVADGQNIALEDVAGVSDAEDAETVSIPATISEKAVMKESTFAPKLMSAQMQQDAQGVPLVDVDGVPLWVIKTYDAQQIKTEIYSKEQFGPDPYLAQAPQVTEDIKDAFTDVVTALQEGKDDIAEKELQTLIDEQPTLSGPAFNMAMLKYKQKALDDAIKFASLALDRNYYNQDARNLLAIIYRGKGDFVKSEELHKKNLTVWGGYDDAYRNLGVLYDLYMGKPEVGLPYYHQYNVLQEEQDRQVLGWTMDIERRLKAQKDASDREQLAVAEAESLVALDDEQVVSDGGLEGDVALVDSPGTETENPQAVNAAQEQAEVEEDKVSEEFDEEVSVENE